MICPVLVEEKDLEEIKKQMVQVAIKHNELVNLFQVNTQAIVKLQDELQEMPGGYRNSQDIKNLKGRIERLEAMKSVDLASFESRVNELEDQLIRISNLEQRMNVGNRPDMLSRIKNLEEFLQSGKNVTVHSRLNDMEFDIKNINTRNQEHVTVHMETMGQIQDDLNHQLKEMKECCRNTVAAGKVLEERCDRVDRNMNVLDGELKNLIRLLPSRVRETIKVIFS